MAFTVEDGSAVPGANSFVSIADFQTYCADRLIDVTQWSENDTMRCLVLASDFLQAQFGLRFSGVPVSPSQRLCWPRRNARRNMGADGYAWVGIWQFPVAYVIPENEVPVEVIEATCELALRVYANTEGLAPDIQPDDMNVTAQKIQDAVAVTYNRRLPYTVWRYPTMRLQPLLASTASNPRISRG